MLSIPSISDDNIYHVNSVINSVELLSFAEHPSEKMDVESCLTLLCEFSLTSDPFCEERNDRPSRCVCGPDENRKFPRFWGTHRKWRQCPALFRRVYAPHWHRLQAISGFLVLSGYKISHTEVGLVLILKAPPYTTIARSLLKLYFLCIVFMEVVKLSLFTTFICFILTSFNHIFFTFNHIFLSIEFTISSLQNTFANLYFLWMPEFITSQGIW